MDYAPETLRRRIQEKIQVISFGPPCTAEDIENAQAQLGQVFPEFLRALYLACDGLQGPTGIGLLWQLIGDNALVGYNLFIRRERWAPPFVHDVIFFGDDGIGGTVGSIFAVDPRRPEKMLEWHVNLKEPEVVASDVLALWHRWQQEWDENSASDPENPI